MAAHAMLRKEKAGGSQVVFCFDRIQAELHPCGEEVLLNDVVGWIQLNPS